MLLANRPRQSPIHVNRRRVGVGIEVTGCHNLWIPRTSFYTDQGKALLASPLQLITQASLDPKSNDIVRLRADQSTDIAPSLDAIRHAEQDRMHRWYSNRASEFW